jgi:DnaJ-class molecular chaperone
MGIPQWRHVKKPNYYEFLQISPNADQDTIHRVYRFLAARYHPDNPITGDANTFRLLKEAYDVLSDPARHAQYDADSAKETEPPTLYPIRSILWTKSTAS